MNTKSFLQCAVIGFALILSGCVAAVVPYVPGVINAIAPDIAEQKFDINSEIGVTADHIESIKKWAIVFESGSEHFGDVLAVRAIELERTLTPPNVNQVRSRNDLLAVMPKGTVPTIPAYVEAAEKLGLSSVFVATIEKDLATNNIVRVHGTIWGVGGKFHMKQLAFYQAKYKGHGVNFDKAVTALAEQLTKRSQKDLARASAPAKEGG